MGAHAGQWEGLGAAFDRDLAEDRLHPVLDGARECGEVERQRRRGIVGLTHPDEARAVAGQGHLGEGTAFGMKLRRRVLVRNLV
ncbi:hypothetical protein D3C71_2063750 [compost metagenome]